MSRRRPPRDRGKVTKRYIPGEAGHRVADAAQRLGNDARIFMIEHVGPLLTPDRRAAVLELAAQGYHPITIEIRLNPPRSVSFLAAGMLLARVDFDAVQ